MARPKPHILMEYKSKNFRTEQILKADAIYAVFNKGKPFNLKSISSTESDIKYKKSLFTNPGHAFGLADKLNKQFNCEDFKVYKFVDEGKIIEKESNIDSYLNQ